MVIFHSYVSLPEGTLKNDPHPTYILTRDYPEPHHGSGLAGGASYAAANCTLAEIHLENRMAQYKTQASVWPFCFFGYPMFGLYHMV